jgi:predicted nucleic-acid-binding protein
MNAIDTNVVIRVVTGDDPVQSEQARALLERETVSVATTVLLESEWVLRSVYGLSKVEAHAVLTAFAGLPTVALKEPDRVHRALKWSADGMDLADALHLAAAVGMDGFKTFDRRLIRHVAGAAEISVSEP